MLDWDLLSPLGRYSCVELRDSQKEREDLVTGTERGWQSVSQSAQAGESVVLREVFFFFFFPLGNAQEFRGLTLSLCARQRQALCASQGENGESYCV